MGLVFVGAVGLWLATRPSLSPEARMRRSQQAAADQSPFEKRQSSLRVQPITDRNPPATEPQSQVPDSTIYEKPQKIRTERFHIVRRDDTLSSISQQYYGSANKWQKILDANRQILKDANKIKPGMRLVIPD